MDAPPLLIEFVTGTRVEREAQVLPGLPIVQNGPPGTHVIFAGGHRVPLPTDQIVLVSHVAGAAHVGFGGMSFVGVEGDQLVFLRVRDLQPAELLSPERSRRMTLETHMVTSVSEGGRAVWPRSYQ